MPDYTDLIRAHADRLNALLETVHRTYGQRSHSAAARREWEQACQVLHAHRSAISHLLERAGREDLGGHNIEAVSEARLMSLDRAAFEHLLSREAEAERRLLVQVLEELEASREWILLLNGPKVINRVASFLVILARRKLDHAATPAHPLEVELPLARNDLAAYLGTRPETLSRTFHELADMSILRLLDPNRFQILNLPALLEASGQDLTWPERTEQSQ